MTAREPSASLSHGASRPQAFGARPELHEPLGLLRYRIYVYTIKRGY
jgi:hypothetical protein